MWLRNVLFLAVVGLIAAGFVVSLLPDPAPAHWERAEAALADGETAGIEKAVNAVDDAFREEWRELGITPSPQAPTGALLRRLSLALTGTIPSLEEIRMLQQRAVVGWAERNETHSAARFRREMRITPKQNRIGVGLASLGPPYLSGEADVVDATTGVAARSAVRWWLEGLLHDPRSSDYIAERLARAYVGTTSGPFLIYRRRRFVSWLAGQLHENRPYDAVVQKLISADGLWTNEPATNFVTVNITPGMEGGGPDETKLAARVYRAFLGVRIDCAQCHDHPFENWTQEDFHNLAAFFGRTEVSFTGIREGRGIYEWEDHEIVDEEASDGDAAENVKRAGAPAVPFQAALLPAEGNRRQRLAGWVTHTENRAFARATVNRFWALMFGRPLVEPVDDIAVDGEYHPALDILARDFAEHGFDLRRLIRLIAATEVFQLDSVEDAYVSDGDVDAAVKNWASFPFTRLRPEQVVGAVLQASSVQTIDHESHVIWRLTRQIQESEFVRRYGDAGEDEFLPHGGTITQRLLMLNGNLIADRTSGGWLVNASTQIANMAPSDRQAIECAYLAVLTRLPSELELQLFLKRLKETRNGRKPLTLGDIYVTLFNTTAFSWNH